MAGSPASRCRCQARKAAPKSIDFLRRFNMSLVMTHEQVWLMDEPDFIRIALQSGARIVDPKDAPLKAAG